MLDVQFKTGTIFKSDATLLINPVNTVGVMGAGLAEQFKKKFPNNYKQYAAYCKTITSFKAYRFNVFEEKGKTIFNFASKEHYAAMSSLSYIRRSLIMLVNYLSKNKHDTIAIPAVGCGLGGLNEKNVLHLILYYLRQVGYDLTVELYQFKNIRPTFRQFIGQVYDLGYRDQDRYTGVGSRNINEHGTERVRRVASVLQQHTYNLVTGDAVKGCDYLFWESTPEHSKVRFGPVGRAPKKSTIIVDKESIAYQRALQIVSIAHPAWRWLPEWTKELHIRNVFQVLGMNVDNPTEFMVCWTPDGAETAKETNKKTGGTGTAIRIADGFGVPVFNLQRDDAIPRLEQYLDIKIVDTLDLDVALPDDQGLMLF